MRVSILSSKMVNGTYCNNYPLKWVGFRRQKLFMKGEKLCAKTYIYSCVDDNRVLVHSWQLSFGAEYS